MKVCRECLLRRCGDCAEQMSERTVCVCAARNHDRASAFTVLRESRAPQPRPKGTRGYVPHGRFRG